MNLDPVPLSRRELRHRPAYLAFAREHGGSPMLLNGRLTFGDGWQHSMYSYEGPAWPPPAEPLECARLRVAYWTRFKMVAVTELEERHHELATVTPDAHPHSVERLEARIGWLEDALADANETLAELAELESTDGANYSI